MDRQIDYIFNIGRRCTTTDFLKKYNLRKIASPFDYLIIDLETSLDLIHNNFEKFLSDVVIFNKNNNIQTLLFQKYTDKVDDRIESFKENDITYIQENYNDFTLRINQNYLPSLVLPDIYKWNRCCLFHHFDLTEKYFIEIVERRVDRFKKLYTENSILIYISHILKREEKEDYINYVLSLYKKYDTKGKLIVVMTIEEESVFERYKLSLIKKEGLYLVDYPVHPIIEKDNENVEWDELYKFIISNFNC